MTMHLTAGTGTVTVKVTKKFQTFFQGHTISL